MGSFSGAVISRCIGQRSGIPWGQWHGEWYNFYSTDCYYQRDVKEEDAKERVRERERERERERKAGGGGGGVECWSVENLERWKHRLKLEI